MEEQKNKNLREVIIIIVVGIVIITFIIFFLFTFFGLMREEKEIICDYDSCSQESYKWEFNGSLCFNSSNPECQDFLRLWNVCQEYKNRIGVC